MKNLIILVFVFFLVLNGNAQQDAKAKSILDQVSQKTRSYQSIAADFNFAMENKAMKINEVNDGSIKIKGDQYFVDIPGSGVKVFSNGKTNWNYMKTGNQVTVSTIDKNSGELMDPSTIFTIYEKGFQSKFVAEKTVDGKIVYQIDLFPDKKEFEVSKITLEINKATLFIQSAQLIGTDGNTYYIRVKKFETNKDFPDADFIFDAKKFPGVEVIDLR